MSNNDKLRVDAQTKEADGAKPEASKPVKTEKKRRPGKSERARLRNQPLVKDEQKVSVPKAVVETPPKDQALWDVPNYSSSMPVVSGFTHNLDFSGFSGILETTYATFRSLDPRVERSMPFCVFQHSMVSRLNAHIIRYVQTETGENRLSDEGSPYDVFGDSTATLLFPASIHEYLLGIGKTTTIEGDFIRINLPLDAIPKIAIPGRRDLRNPQGWERMDCDPGSFGPITAVNHNLYECYFSPRVTKQLVRTAIERPDGGANWEPLPPGFYPAGAVVTRNFLGYRMSERIAPDFRTQLNEIQFVGADNMAGRLCHSPEIERIVNDYFKRMEHLITMRVGFPTFTQNPTATIYARVAEPLEPTVRLSDYIGELRSHCAVSGPDNCRAGLLALTRERTVEAPGLCVLPAEHVRAAWIATRNSNFEMAEPFSSVSAAYRDCPILRMGNWRTNPPIGYRIDQLVMWVTKHFKSAKY